MPFVEFNCEITLNGKNYAFNIVWQNNKFSSIGKHNFCMNYTLIY